MTKDQQIWDITLTDKIRWWAFSTAFFDGPFTTDVHERVDVIVHLTVMAPDKQVASERVRQIIKSLSITSDFIIEEIK